MGISFANLLIILLIVLLVFGAGKLPKIMGDLGKGIKNFKNNIKDDENTSSQLDDKTKHIEDNKDKNEN